jgi:hypothetical protein
MPKPDYDQFPKEETPDLQDVEDEDPFSTVAV